MFKVTRKVIRADHSVPFFGDVIPFTKEYGMVFHAKYIKTKKFLGMDKQVSEDGLTFTTVASWASEDDYLDYISDSNAHISDFLEKVNLYIDDNKFIDSITYESFDYPTFYDQAHIFVIFRPGAAGNFISNLLDNLLNNKSSSIELSSTGHAHYNSIVEHKRLGIDYLSLGSGLPGNDSSFFNEEDKIKFYKEKISAGHYENKRYITWTHNFSNIPLYKSIFPNCKILIINDDTLKERLISMVMNINKNLFSPDDQLPLTVNDRRRPKIFKRKLINDYFSRCYPTKVYQKGHKDLDLHLLYSSHLSAYNINKHYNADLNAVIDYEDDNRDPSLSYIERKIQYSVGREYINHADAKIEFQDILGRSVTNIATSLELILDKKLTHDELIYLESALEKYVLAQDRTLLEDPRKYLEQVKEKADTTVSAFEDKLN